jgi:hypothetical protein
MNRQCYVVMQALVVTLPEVQFPIPSRRLMLTVG